MRKKKATVRMWLLAALGIVLVCLLCGMIWSGQEWSPARIERITGVRVPEYEITNIVKGERGFNGDYEDLIDLEFKSVPSDELFMEIDKMIAAGNTEWRRDGRRYSFSVRWGNGYPAPPGEREEDDGMFSITITRGERTGEIRCGAW
jgi:hypothetical protein